MDAGQAWTKKYLNWIRVHVHFEEPALEVTVAHYLHEVDHAAERIVKLEQAIDVAVQTASPQMRAVIDALQSLRGVALTTAATVVCELGSLSRFESPRQLMAYSGLVPREHSSGNKVHRGAITKTGNAHLRRVLVESAWSYQHRLSAQGRLLRRQKSLDLDDAVKHISWKAQQRLCKRFTALSSKGKARGQVITAVARELLGFMWAIARQAEAKTA